MINAKDSKNTFYILNKKENTPIVLIHGVGLNHKIWEPQINSFNNTVLAYDILGHGNTPLTKSQISFDDFSLQLLNLIDELKFEKMHLVGFSIGSLIARNFASKYNNRLESLTLLCSVFQRSNEQQQIVNDRFELSKKSRSLSKQALKRWFTDDYINKNPNIYEKIYISPNPSDRGLALGCAYYGAAKKGEKVKPLQTPYLGSKYRDKEKKKELAFLNERKQKIKNTKSKH